MNKDQELKQLHSTGSTVSRALPGILRQVKENSLSILSNQLTEFFNSCDDLFFELANHAGSNNEQNLYFDSMREIRLKKNDVNNLFKDNFNQSFSRLLQPTPVTPAEPAATFDTLGIVEDDRMEQEVAISSVVSKTRQDCQENLYHLNIRFDYLLNGIKVSEANNPLDPRQVCECFVTAVSTLELDIKAKIILFKQFDRMVARHLNKIYRLANELLINAGVLSKLNPSDLVKKPANKPQARRAEKPLDGSLQEPKTLEQPPNIGQSPSDHMIPETQASESLPQYSFEQLSGLLSSVREAANASPIGVGPAISTASDQYGAAISQEDLLNQLNQLQIELIGSRTPQSKEQFQEAIYEILEKSSETDKPNSLHQSDEDVINLVSMFFEFILDDRNLPVPIQALISRLQIPILKVALKDKSFFNNSQHTSRQLINEIASLSVGWEEAEKQKQDSLYELINDIVHVVNNEFVGEVSVFETQLKRLKEFNAAEIKRAQIVETRSKQAAEGKAKTDHAKNIVQNLLYQRLKEKQLPELVSNFLVDHWQKVLLMVKLKSGDNSPEWLANLQVVDDLVWVGQGHSDEKSKKRVSRITPKLLETIKAGLPMTSLAKDQQDTLLSDLADLLSKPEAIEIDPNQVQLKPKQLASLGQVDDESNKTWKEMSALERQQVKHKALQFEFLKKAENLQPGTWFESKDPDSGKQSRLKLASVIKETEQYIFVNRFGFKVVDKTKQEVALGMQKELLVKLEGGLLFDRAMSKIAANLKNPSTSSTSPQAI